MRRFFALLPLAAITSATAQTRSAPAAMHSVSTLSSVDTTVLHGLRFRMVGPPRGGRVTTVTGVPSQPQTFYMGVASGGLFRTTDAGASWVPITDGKVAVASTGDVAVAESDPNTIYLGTGSDDIRSNVSTGRGVYKSTDAGRTWTLRDSTTQGHRCRAHPSNESNVVWVAAIERVQSEHGTWRVRPRTVADVAGRCCSSRTASVRRTSSSIRRILTWCTPGCGAANGSPGRSSAVRVRADSTRAPTAASTSPRSRTVCRATSWERPTSP